MVAPRASELIHPVALAVGASLTVDQVAHAFTVYPSLTGSIAEAARQLHHGALTGVRTPDRRVPSAVDTRDRLMMVCPNRTTSHTGSTTMRSRLHAAATIVLTHRPRGRGAAAAVAR